MKRFIYIVAAMFCIWQTGHAQEEIRRHLDRYDYGKAVEVIDSLMARENADSVSLAVQKAKCLRRIYRTEEAVATLSEVLHLDQFNVELMAELAECHVQTGNTEEAFTLYSMLTNLQPDNTYFKMCQARILYREKEYHGSIEIFKQVAARDSLPEVLALIGDGYKNLGLSDSAMVYYDAVLRRKPAHAPTISKKADIMLAAKQYEPVAEMCHTYLAERPDDLTILPIYGLTRYLQERYAQSIQTFFHMQELGDDSYPVHYYLGMNYYSMNYWPDAIPELEKAYQIDSSDVKLVYQLAHAKSHMYSSKDLNQESERLYKKALEMLQPDPGLIHNIYGSMALARHSIEKYQDAIKYYELSYKYNPKNISAISAIAHCYERLKKYDKALEYYERYLKLAKPGSAGYKYAEESIAYIKQEKFMQE